MNSNVTVSNLGFNQVYSDKTGSLRRETSRGINLPTELKIAHSDIVDSSTKLPSQRSVVRFDRYIALTTEAVTAPVSGYVVVQFPKSTSVTAADITAVMKHLGNLLLNFTDTSAGLDLQDEIFGNREQ